MSVINRNLPKIRRPRLLLQAARIASGTYRRERDLRRLLKTQRLGSKEVDLHRLYSLEDELDQSRRARDTTYSITRHVEILAAVLAEMQNSAKRQPG